MIKRLICFTTAFIIGLYSLCFFDCKIDAASATLITLTPEQTLALYGTSISGIYYNPNTHTDNPITFDFVQMARDWVPTNLWDRGLYIYAYSSSAYYGSGDHDAMNYEYLVYYASLSNFVTTQNWESHANIYLPFSVSFPGVSAFQQRFFYPTRNGYLNTGYSSAWTCYLDTSIGMLPYAPAHSGTNSLLTCQIPTYQHRAGDSLVESQTCVCAGIYFDRFDLDATYDVNGVQLNLSMVEALDMQGRIYPDNIYNDVPTKGLFLFVQCPQVSNYTLPLTGTGQTATYPTQQTVDLSNLESGVAAIVREEQNNNAWNRVHTDQLNTIIDQLNAIYAAMARNGEVPVSLDPADPYAVFNSDVLHDIDGITTHTMAQLPPVGNGAQAVGSLVDEVFSLNSIFMAVGAFSLGFAVFCWFVFRGRG